MTEAANRPTHQPDNLLGICRRIGADFGFDPLWLRIGLGAAFILAPLTVVLVYLAMGAVVLASRLLCPVRARRSAEVVTLPVAPPAPPELAKAA